MLADGRWDLTGSLNGNRLSETHHWFPRQSEGEVYASLGHPFSLAKWVGE
jgi:hypothetical protein